MLKKFQKPAIILVIFFFSIHNSFSQSNNQKTEEEHLSEAEDLARQLQSIQKVIDDGFGRDNHQNDGQLDGVYGKYKDVTVEVSRTEDDYYCYFRLTFSGLREELLINAKNNKISFLSKNKTNKNKSGKNKAGFNYVFQIPNPNYSKKPEIIREGNVVIIKAPKPRRKLQHKNSLSHQNASGI